ncbi:MAG: hypothetical protein JW776_05935 [Candidatus Lokiarchaeota archaeon]|nr:hypothetical protein [Candidatus Lokiarchaeota archaeon]
MGLIFKKTHPEIFQGTIRKRFYFEGWYFKIVDATGENIFALIPGVALNKKLNSSHAFIQILNGKTAEYNYLRFPLSEFYAEKDKFMITVGNNQFSRNDIHLDIDSPIPIKGDLEFSDFTLLERSIINPGVMGPFTWLPFMETKHGVLSMNHTIQGILQIQDKNINFSNGKGYIEKDWGTSFPSNWIWMQSNHFNDANKSFMFSMAKIRYLGWKFTGFLGVLSTTDEIIRFGTYTRAKIHNLVITPTSITFEIRTKRDILKITAQKSMDATGSSKTAQMLAPERGEMSAKCLESISSTIHITHSKIHHGKKEIVFEDIGVNSGLEIMGTRDDFF